MNSCEHGDADTAPHSRRGMLSFGDVHRPHPATALSTSVESRGAYGAVGPPPWPTIPTDPYRGSRIRVTDAKRANNGCKTWRIVLPSRMSLDLMIMGKAQYFYPADDTVKSEPGNAWRIPSLACSGARRQPFSNFIRDYRKPSI
jgi:hypothetical protein